jgi:hypothetical protein
MSTATILAQIEDTLADCTVSEDAARFALGLGQAEDPRTADPQAIKAQIGMWNVLATSGGRVIIRDTGITLPCGYGYSVTVDLDPSDTYTVRRVFTRSGVASVKGERTDVYAEQLGETVYRAGCFHDSWA